MGTEVAITSTNNGGYFYGSDQVPSNDYTNPPALHLKLPTQTLAFRVANWSEGAVTQVKFSVYAKNGDATAMVRHTDGTTYNFTIQDNVNSNYPGFVHQEVLDALPGKQIHEIYFWANADWYIIDNVIIKTIIGSAPSQELIDAVATAQNVYNNKLSIYNQEVSEDYLLTNMHKLMNTSILTKKEASYFVFKGAISNQAYNKMQPIKIVNKKGDLEDIVEASDQLNLQALSKPVKKFFICYPKKMELA